MIDVFVIGIKGQLRSKSLEEWTSSFSHPQNIAFVDPVYSTRGQVPRLLDIYTGLHYGNRLTNGEWGCSLAHLRAQVLALSKSSAWALFLEDDARLTDKFSKNLERLASMLPVNEAKPLGVHCLGVRAISATPLDADNLQFLKTPPPLGAVGYLLNRSALELVHRSQHIGYPVGKADFPPWAFGVAWATMASPIVFHEESAISLVGPRWLASRPRGRFFKLAHALTRLVLFFVPIIKIPSRLAWELDFIWRRAEAVRLRLSSRYKS